MKKTCERMMVAVNEVKVGILCDLYRKKMIVAKDVVKESKELLRLKEGEKTHCDFEGDDIFFKKSYTVE